MNPAKPEHIATEKRLLGNVWSVLKSVASENLNSYPKWQDVVEATRRLETVVATCNNPLLMKFAEQISLSVVRHISTEQMGGNHEEEAKVFNECFRILRLAYWIKHDGEQAAEDWEEIMNMARAIPSTMQENVRGLAISMLASLVGYISDISEERFNKAMNKAEKVG